MDMSNSCFKIQIFIWSNALEVRKALWANQKNMVNNFDVEYALYTEEQKRHMQSLCKNKKFTCKLFLFL